MCRLLDIENRAGTILERQANAWMGLSLNVLPLFFFLRNITRSLFLTARHCSRYSGEPEDLSAGGASFIALNIHRSG